MIIDVIDRPRSPSAPHRWQAGTGGNGHRECECDDGARAAAPSAPARVVVPQLQLQLQAEPGQAAGGDRARVPQRDACPRGGGARGARRAVVRLRVRAAWASRRAGAGRGRARHGCGAPGARAGAPRHHGDTEPGRLLLPVPGARVGSHGDGGVPGGAAGQRAGRRRCAGRAGGRRARGGHGGHVCGRCAGQAAVGQGGGGGRREGL